MKSERPWLPLVVAGAAVAGVALLARRRDDAEAPDFTEPAEDFAELDPNFICDPTPKPGVRKFRDFVLRTFGGADLGIVRACTGATLEKQDEHMGGRAWDWGTTPDSPEAAAFLSWLLGNDAEMARRAGVMYVIFDRQIWRAYGPREWQAYTGPSPHTDHVHLSFSRAGAAGETSFYLDARGVAGAALPLALMLLPL